jgi:hypothetical protein
LPLKWYQLYQSSSATGFNTFQLIHDTINVNADTALETKLFAKSKYDSAFQSVQFVTQSVSPYIDKSNPIFKQRTPNLFDKQVGKIRETAPRTIASAFESGVETSALKADGAIASPTRNMWFSASFTCKLANYLAI